MARWSVAIGLLLAAPFTATGLATQSSPSTQATCTFNHLKPNPRTSWYAIKL
jgi:hypothetical protein